MNKGQSWFNTTSVALGFAFLYAPILILVIYSFNDSKLVTVWGGFSFRWYLELLQDQAMLDAAWITLRLAFLSATIATVLGTLAAITLVRFGRFLGRSLFSGMIYAPLVMPDVITGLSLLLLFVSIDIDRGFWTVTLAHVTLTMCFVAIVVQSRLVVFDRSLEEAALDLGCPPFKTFIVITLPLILPAVVAGWMLAFTLSLDDLVILHHRPRRDDAADEDLQPGQVRRDAGDQRHLDDPDRHRRHRRADGLAGRQAARGRAPEGRATRPARLMA